MTPSRSRQSAQSLVELAAVLFVLLLFALGLLAVGLIVQEYVAVRSAAGQAVLAAARAPSAEAARQAASLAAMQAVQASQVEDFTMTLDMAGFDRGETITVTTHGYVGLTAFPIVSQVLGDRFELTWRAHALIEPYRSRSR